MFRYGIVILGVFAMVALIATDFAKHRAVSVASLQPVDPIDFSVADYWEALTTRHFPELDVEPSIEISQYLPKRVEGWRSRDMSEADQFRLFGAVGSMPGSFDSSLGDPARDMLSAIYTYENGVELVALRVEFAPSAPLQPVESNLPADFGHPLVSVAGVMFNEGPQDRRSGTRNLRADLGDQIHIYIAAQATDMAIVEILEGLDLSGLNELLDMPVAGVGGPSTPTHVLISAANSALDPDLEKAIEAALTEAMSGVDALPEQTDDPRPENGDLHELGVDLVENPEPGTLVEPEKSAEIEKTQKISCVIEKGAKRCKITYE